MKVDEFETDANWSCEACRGEVYKAVSFVDCKSGGDLLVVQCKHCGFVQQKIIPSDDHLSIYYSHNYRTDYKNTFEPKLKYVYRAGKSALDRLKTFREIRVTAGKVLIDIGAGGGEFVYLASLNGFEAIGIEPNIGYKEYAKKNYGVQILDTEIAKIPDGCCDVVTMFHSLEHIAHPWFVFEKLYQILREDGVLYIEVPNILALDASPNNIFFRAHLYYFSSSTLQTFASRYFQCIHLEDKGNLKIVFEKRKAPLKEPVMPTSEDVASDFRRLNEKTWINYLKSGALKKPFSKLYRLTTEARLRGNPRDILKQLYSGHLQS